jgi:hypothetical protein
MSQSKTPITDERQLQCESLSDQAWGFEGWTLAGQHEIKIALLKNTLLNDRDAARAEGIEMEEKLTAVTEQRDKAWQKIENQAERITYLEGATNHATGTPLSKAIEQRDSLAEAVNAATILIAAKGRHNTMLAYEGLRKAVQSLTPNVKEHAPLSAGANVDHGVKVKTTGEHENRAADRGCCVSPCSISSFLLEGLRHKDPAVRVMKYLAVTTLIGHIVLIGGSLIYKLTA